MGIGFRELLVILLIALLVFGAKKLRNIGTDLGAAVKGFKQAMNDGDTADGQRQLKQDTTPDADFGSEKHAETAKDSKNS